MFKVDYHVHSGKSFDADPKASIEAIFRTSVSRGINETVLCDHYDVNWVISGENPDIDFGDTLNQINEVRDKFKGENTESEILLGIELGQPHQCPEKAEEVLSKNEFDFVLCSLHNARDEKDFYYIDYENTDILRLIAIFEKYTNELCELANWGNFHSLAHITYPVRYFLLNNIHIPMKKYTDLYKQIFSIIIRRGIALEINTSGLRKRINVLSPSYDLLKLYREAGGELITVGSDAHNTSDIFSGILHTYQRLSALGFKYISTVKDKKLIQRKIEV